MKARRHNRPEASVRGCGWNNNTAANCRAANRNDNHPANRNANQGFRPASARHLPEAWRLRISRPCPGRDHGPRACAEPSEARFNRLGRRPPARSGSPLAAPDRAPIPETDL